MHLGGLFGRITATVLLVLPATTWSMQPLITDDTGTQGKGKFQLEVYGQFEQERETIQGVSIKETDTQLNTALTYGFVDSADLILTLPYEWDSVRAHGIQAVNVNGISDSTLEVKWRFCDREGLSFAIKPGLVLPTGDDEKGLGSGKVGYRAFFVVTKELEPWSFYVNLGYLRNNNTADARNDIWSASAAVVRTVTKQLKVVADIGIQTGQDPQLNTNPAYVLAGVVYSPAENFDIDFGVKVGLTRGQNETMFTPGLTYRF